MPEYSERWDQLTSALEEVEAAHPELKFVIELGQLQVIYPVDESVDHDWGFYPDKYPQFESIFQAHDFADMLGDVDFNWGDDPSYDDNHGFILYNLR